MRIRLDSARIRLVLAIASLALATPVLGQTGTRWNAQPAVPPDTRPVDVVIALDTSGSMENLIDAARARLWDIVNEFARMTPTPELRVGLLTYGSQESTEEEGWIILNSDLTNDLDTLYGELMSLTTSGDQEYVGRALHTALEGMTWSRDPEALRLIFVAGNESADQAVEEYDFREVVRDALEDDIIVNALYAGNREQAIVEKWHELARHGRGTFSAIDPETSTIQIASPQDEALLALNARLNGTYLPYGAHGADGLANQLAQDGNASRLGVQSCSSRIVAKGSALYNNASWDLVDATLQEGFDWAALGEENLPEELRSMTDEERIRHVAEKRAEREAIQLRIQELSAQREEHIKAALARERMAAGLDEAMREAIRNQAKAKGFTCDGC